MLRSCVNSARFENKFIRPPRRRDFQKFENEVKRFNFKRLALIAAALLWLPAGIAASAVIRGFGLRMDAMVWISLRPAMVAGLPLAIAVRLIYRLGKPRIAWAVFVVFAPVSTYATLLGGLLGPLGIIAAASVISIPAFLIFAIAFWGNKRSRRESRSG